MPRNRKGLLLRAGVTGRKDRKEQRSPPDRRGSFVYPICWEISRHIRWICGIRDLAVSSVNRDAGPRGRRKENLSFPVENGHRDGKDSFLPLAPAHGIPEGPDLGEIFFQIITRGKSGGSYGVSLRDFAGDCLLTEKRKEGFPPAPAQRGARSPTLMTHLMVSRLSTCS